MGDEGFIYEVWILPALTRRRKKPGHRAEIRQCGLQLGSTAVTADWKLRHKTKVRASMGKAIKDGSDWLIKHRGEPDA